MSITHQPIFSPSQPFMQSLGGGFGRWQNLSISSQPGYSNLIKIIAVSAIFLAIGLVFRAYRSKPADPKNTQLLAATCRTLNKSPTTTSTVNVENLHFYNDWVSLKKHLTVHDLHRQIFKNYEYKGDKTIKVAFSRDTEFFHANCDESNSQGIEDLGWGCAWRCIQTCLAAFTRYYSIKSLMHSMNKTGNHWAEPGYAAQIFTSLGISNKLYLYNKKEGTDKTPTAFCTHLASFSNLCETLFEHFEKFHTPVMADDVTFACSILGIKSTEKGNIILWIADPHKTSREAGLYYLVLDGKTGDKLHCTGVDDGSNGLSTAQKIFPNKGWMLFFPQSQIIPLPENKATF